MFFFKGFSKFNKTAVREVKYFYIKDTKDTRKKMFTIRSKKNYFKNIDFKERGGGGCFQDNSPGGNSPEDNYTGGKFSRGQSYKGQILQEAIFRWSIIPGANYLG